MSSTNRSAIDGLMPHIIYTLVVIAFFTISIVYRFAPPDLLQSLLVGLSIIAIYIILRHYWKVGEAVRSASSSLLYEYYALIDQHIFGNIIILVVVLGFAIVCYLPYCRGLVLMFNIPTLIILVLERILINRDLKKAR